MRTLRRIALVVTVGVVAVAAFVAWSTYGAWPVPKGYEFPRHSQWGGPQALFEGTLVDVGGCILTDGGDTVIWPPFSSLAIVDGEPVVRVGLRELRIGEPVALGGGYYDHLATVGGAADTECPEPFFMTTGRAD